MPRATEVGVASSWLVVCFCGILLSLWGGVLVFESWPGKEIRGRTLRQYWCWRFLELWIPRLALLRLGCLGLCRLGRRLAARGPGGRFRMTWCLEWVELV